MFCAMIVSACEARVPAGSAASDVFIAARTSGGRSVDVRMTSWSTLSKKDGSMVCVSIVPGRPGHDARMNTKMQECRNAGMQGKDAEMQECGNARMQE